LKKNLLVYGGFIVKMDNSHLFEMILIFLFHAWEVMDNEIYKEHGFFSYMYVCIDVVHFTMDLVTWYIIEIYMFTNCSIFSFVCIPYTCASLIYKRSMVKLVPNILEFNNEIKIENMPKKIMTFCHKCAKKNVLWV
jgi:hypothetical protein